MSLINGDIQVEMLTFLLFMVVFIQDVWSTCQNEKGYLGTGKRNDELHRAEYQDSIASCQFLELLTEDNKHPYYFGQTELEILLLESSTIVPDKV